MKFHELPDAERMALRHLIEVNGGLVCGYQGDAVQVAIPRPSAPFYDALNDDGRLECVDGSLHFFPLGSDKAPDSLRHDGQYRGSRGYWLYGSYRPS